MKLALLADPHLVPPGEKIYGVDPFDRLDRALAAVSKYAGDADLLVLLGDLVHNGEPEVYALLRKRVDQLGIPVRVLIGNHDDRDAIKAAWPDLPVDSSGFLQSQHIDEELCLLFLDTAGPAGTNPGRLCAARRDWLRQALANGEGRPTFIFMHHPPADLGFKVDATKLVESNELADLIASAGNVHHIFAGHTHRAAAGNWRGVTWTCLHGISQQVHLDYPAVAQRLVAGPAQIGIVHIMGGDSVLHYHDFLEPYEDLAI